MRLTKKEKNCLASNRYMRCDYLLDGTPKVEALNKLGQIEDLMDKYNIPNVEYLENCIIDHDKYGEVNEKLGCSMEVLIRALNDGIWQDVYGRMFHYNVVTDGKCLFAIPRDIFDEMWALAEYKTSWWLEESKEE